jgi:hypothetical protein
LAVTRLAEAGCEVPEIATITGHSLADAITSAGPKLAMSAVAKLERAGAATGTDSEEKLENIRTVPDATRDKWLKSLSGRTRTRTLDPLIKRQSLSL